MIKSDKNNKVRLTYLLQPRSLLFLKIVRYVSCFVNLFVPPPASYRLSSPSLVLCHPILHSSNTQLHLHYSYTLTLFHSYILPILHTPILHTSNLTHFQSYTLPILHFSNLLLCQFYTLPILHPSNFAPFQS